MTGKKNDGLREGFKALRVNQPFNLSKTTPSFRVPDGTNKQEAPRNEAPRLEAPHYKQTQIEQSQVETPQKEAPQFERPHNEVGRAMKSRENTGVCQPPQNKYAHPERPRSESAQSEPPQNEIAQNKGPQFKAPQNEQPQIEKASVNGLGFFKLSDRTFSSPQLQKLSGDCFRLFVWMSSKAWRYQNSDGTLRASIGYIESATGMSHATISRCVKALRDEGLIKLLENDYKRGNLWKISPVALGGSGPGDMPPQFEPPQNEGPQKETVAASKRGGSSLNLRAKPPQNEGEIRNIEYIEISQKGAGPLFARISKLRAAEKQKSERESLNTLLKTYSGEELESAVTYLEKHGILGSHAPCHSPFRYLVSAADDVLKAVSKNRLVARVTPPARDVDVETSKRQADEAMMAFESELTSPERESFVQQYVQKEFNWGYLPKKELLSRLVAVHWYSQRHGQQQLARACG